MFIRIYIYFNVSVGYNRRSCCKKRSYLSCTATSRPVRLYCSCYHHNCHFYLIHYYWCYSSCTESVYHRTSSCSGSSSSV